jgi:hypothetical protein
MCKTLHRVLTLNAQLAKFPSKYSFPDYFLENQPPQS